MTTRRWGVGVPTGRVGLAIGARVGSKTVRCTRSALAPHWRPLPVAELVDHPAPAADPAAHPAPPTPLPAEIRLLAGVQRAVGGRAVGVARGMSVFGEHAGGWLGLGALGPLVDRPRRREWLTAAAGVAFAHGASIGVKRVVRRTPPEAPSPAARA